MPKKTDKIVKPIDAPFDEVASKLVGGNSSIEEVSGEMITKEDALNIYDAGLIHIHNQGSDFLVDSREVAKVFDVTHKHLLRHIDTHTPELQRLGFLRVESAKIEGRQKRGRPDKYYWLNVDQVFYLLTLSKTTEQSKEYRVQLILAFRAASEQMRPVDGLLLSVPDKWRKKFKDEFYIALLNVYGVSYDKSKNKPSWVGNWTNKFIYEPIYKNMSSELKRRRKQYCSNTGKDSDWIKLHQFLEDHAKDELGEMITKVTTLLELSGTKTEFAEHYAALFRGETQVKMDDLLRDDYS